jgi:hypothetical protein
LRVYDAKNIKFKDGLTEKRRRVFVLKILFFVGLVITVVGFVLYLLFFSGLLEIKEVSVNGLNKVSSDEFNNRLNDRLNSKWLGLLERQKNVVLFDSDAFRAEVFIAFPEIKNISINKKPPHTLNIDVTERATSGIWCFIDDCKYFDEEGSVWGEAVKSSGFLILVIDDLRQNIQELDLDLLADIMLISERLKEMNIFVNRFVISEDSNGDFTGQAVSNGYAVSILFSTDSDISGQLEVLEIFLAEKKDPSAPDPVGEQVDDIDFRPQYIDLRINGRIYYKKQE